MLIEMLIAGAAGLILLASSGILSMVIAVVMLAVVSKHAHGTVIKPQLETLH
jgi:hypothetical protein